MGEFNLENNIGGSGDPGDIQEVQNPDINSIPEFLEFEKRYGGDIFLTGSRAWGIEKEDSDFDYCCTQKIFSDISMILENEKVSFKRHKNFSALYVGDKEHLYNIISLDDYEFESWRFATKIMRVLTKMGKIDEWSSKHKIYGVFGFLKSLNRILSI